MLPGKKIPQDPNIDVTHMINCTRHSFLVWIATTDAQNAMGKVIWQAIIFTAHVLYTLNSSWNCYICGNCGALWNAFTENQEVTEYQKTR